MITFESIIEEKLKELEKTQKNFWNIARETANFINIFINIIIKKILYL